MVSSGWAEDEWVRERYDDYEAPPLDPWHAGRSSASDRTVAYLVLVDGHVVDEWHEPLRQSPWRSDPRVERVQRLWREKEKPAPEPRPWLETVRWLEHVVGGSDQLAALTVDPLPDEEFHLPEGAVGDGDLVARFRRTTTLLDGLAEELFDAEMRTAFRRALSSAGLEALGGAQPADPVQVAASVCWLVVRANGLMTPAGSVTQKSITSHLGLSSFPTAKARVLGRLLGAPKPPWVTRPYGLPELEAFSRTDLLTSRTRAQITSLRDAALTAEAAASARDQARGRELEVDLLDLP